MGVVVPTNLEITVSEVAEDCTVFLDGEIDLDTAPALVAELNRLTEADRHRIRVDLRAVSFMDSQGIHAISTTQRRLSAVGGTIILVAPPEPVRRALELAGFDRILPIEEG
jgi:anti-anti-sigma factor